MTSKPVNGANVMRGSSLSTVRTRVDRLAVVTHLVMQQLPE